MRVDATVTKYLIPKSVTHGLKWENIGPSQLGLTLIFNILQSLNKL